MAKGNSDDVIKAKGIYNGYYVRGNFDVELRFIFPESQLMSALQFTVGITKRLRLIAKVEETKVKLGEWNVYRLTVDKNLQTQVVFKSNIDSVFVDNISELMSEDAEINIAAQITNN